MNGWARPTRPVSPIAVALLILGVWWLVAHNSGAGWVQAIGDVVFGTLAVGIVGPALVLAVVKIEILSAPTDGTAGLPTEVVINASTRLRVRALDPPGAQTFIGPVGGHRSADNTVLLLPECRGVHDAVTLDIATAAPFALQWWTRRVRLPLPSALHVAPRRGRPDSMPFRPDEDAGESTAWVPSDEGQPRGARPYRSGDNRRHVHWRATAHAGELMVRELEGPAAEPVTVAVMLPPDPDEAERVAERALGTILLLIDRGAPVRLATIESTGGVVAPVADRHGAGRRLARAVPGADAASGPAGITVIP